MKKSALPSQHQDLMFVVYGRPGWYEIKAFNEKGELSPKYCFNINLGKTLLPHNSGFCSVGPTLYVIGGVDVPHDDITTHERTLDTYMIDFYKIPHFDNHLPSNHAELHYSQKGPTLKGHKLAPIVIVVGGSIYAFSRFLELYDTSHKFEVLDVGIGREGKGEWVGLPEPPFKEDLGIGNVNDFVLKIESYVVNEASHSCIIIHVSGSDPYDVYYNAVYKFHLEPRMWTLLRSKTVPFYGKALLLSGLYFALRYTPRFWDNVVCGFAVDTPALYVEESLPTRVVDIDDMESPPKEVRYHPLSEVSVFGDTLFIARVGYDSNDEDTANHHFTLDRFQVTVKDERAKAVHFSRKSYPIKGNGSMFCPSTLYCVPWYNEHHEAVTDSTRGKEAMTDSARGKEAMNGSARGKEAMTDSARGKEAMTGSARGKG